MYAYPTDFNTSKLYRQLEQLAGSLTTPLPDKPVRVGEFLTLEFTEIARSTVHVRFLLSVTSPMGHEFSFKVNAYTSQQYAYAVTYERCSIVLNRSQNTLHNFDWDQHYKINNDFQIIMDDFSTQPVLNPEQKREELAA